MSSASRTRSLTLSAKSPKAGQVFSDQSKLKQRSCEADSDHREDVVWSRKAEVCSRTGSFVPTPKEGLHMRWQRKIPREVILRASELPEAGPTCPSTLHHAWTMLHQRCRVAAVQDAAMQVMRAVEDLKAPRAERDGEQRAVRKQAMWGDCTYRRTGVPQPPKQSKASK